MEDRAREFTVEAHDVAPERKGIKKGLYLLPTAFTAANVGMGYYAVMGALRDARATAICTTLLLRCAG